MGAQTLRDLFVYELSSIYDAEQKGVQMAPQIMAEIGIPQAQAALQQHDQETHQQIQNLERCFQILGTQPLVVKCFVLHGFEQEHDAFIRDNPSPEMLAMFDLCAQEKIEDYESAAYRFLVEKANLIGLPECARLLQENLRQEEDEACRINQISHTFGQQIIHHTGQQSQRRV